MGPGRRARHGQEQALGRAAAARTHARLGDHARAVADAGPIETKLDKDGGLLLEVACVFALASAAAAADQKLPVAERDACGRSTASRRRALCRSADAGFRAAAVVDREPGPASLTQMGGLSEAQGGMGGKEASTRLTSFATHL